MSRLNKLMGKPVNIMIEGVELEIEPLKMKDVPLLMEASSKDENKQGKAIIKILHKTLKKAVPEATDEEIENVALTHFQVLVDAVMKVNGIEDVNSKKG